jgi:hypothetical protein
MPIPETTSAEAFERNVGGKCLAACRGKAWRDINAWIIAPPRKVDLVPLPAGRRADIRRVNPPVFKSGVCHFIAEAAAGVPAVLPAHRDSRLESQRCRNKHG